MRERKNTAESLGKIRLDLRHWVEIHLQDLHRAGHGSTLWHGVMQKCCAQVETLMSRTARQLLAGTGQAGADALGKVGNGKDIERFTLGQYMALVKALEKPLNQLLDEHVHLRAACTLPLIGKAMVRQMDRISRLRSDFAHNRWPIDHGNSSTAEFLGEVAELADASFVRLAIELERSSA